jgi:hypothetical protein
MTQPLNYTPKAIADLLAYECAGMSGTAAGLRYIADKLSIAEVFILRDHGQLLDRTKPRPQVPGVMFRPPFPVVALEFEANPAEWDDAFYNPTRCSRRIALAWEWQDDLPPPLKALQPPDMRPSVVVASICYHDATGSWMPMGAACALEYDDVWQHEPVASDFKAAMIQAGRLSKRVASEPGLSGTLVHLMPESVLLASRQFGIAATLDSLGADLMDEVNAYTDLCYALACKNVSTREHGAPKFLNRQRIKKGKLPLRGFHVLELNGGGEMPGARDSAGDRAGCRSHLRRGHIRRLGADRVTWVNSTVVRGRGFVDKVYAA